MLARFSVLSRLRDAREFATSIPRCASMTARACTRSIRARAACRNTGTPPASTRAWTGSRPASPSRSCRRPSTTTPIEVAADPVHLMYVLEQAIRREQLPEETGEALSRVHQGRARAALCRVHRPRDPEGLSGILPRLRPEPVRPLRRLCRCLDRGPGLQGSRHRPAAQPRAPEPGADQDREAGRHRQPEGLPQRGGQVLACARGPATMAATRPGPATRRSARSSSGACSARSRTCCRSSASARRRTARPRRSTASSCERMVERGYTERQVRRLVEWYMRVKQAG